MLVGPSKCLKQIIQIELNRVKNPNWPEASQLQSSSKVLRRLLLFTDDEQNFNVCARNRPFYRYGGHIELIRFKEYYGMPRGHEHDPIYSLSIYARFSGQFFSKFSEKKIEMGKTFVVPCLDVITIAFFPRNI